MTRLAPLLCLLAAASAEAREPVRVVYRAPAGPPVPSPWTLHPVLVLPTPLLAVSDRDTTDGGTTAEFFARLTDLGFACVTREPPAAAHPAHGGGLRARGGLVQLRGRLAQ